MKAVGVQVEGHPTPSAPFSCAQTPVSCGMDLFPHGRKFYPAVPALRVAGARQLERVRRGRAAETAPFLSSIIIDVTRLGGLVTDVV